MSKVTIAMIELARSKIELELTGITSTPDLSLGDRPRMVKDYHAMRQAFAIQSCPVSVGNIVAKQTEKSSAHGSSCHAIQRIRVDKITARRANINEFYEGDIEGEIRWIVHGRCVDENGILLFCEGPKGDTTYSQAEYERDQKRLLGELKQAIITS